MKRLSSDEHEQDILRAIFALEGDIRWEKVKKWFEESKNEAIDSVRSDPNFAYNAGMLNQICDLCEQIEGARETLKAINRE